MSGAIAQGFIYISGNDCVRSALEQLPNEGAGFMLSNLLIRDTHKPVHPASAPDDMPLFIQFLHEKKQAFLDTQFANGGSVIVHAIARVFTRHKLTRPTTLGETASKVKLYEISMQ